MHWTRRLAALCLLLLASAVALAQQLPAIPQLTSYATDHTGTLDAAGVAALDANLRAFETRTGSQLVVLLVPTTGDLPIEDYALKVAEKNQIGRKKLSDGVLLLVVPNDRKVRIEVGYGLEGAIPDIAAGRVIQEYLVPKFRQGDYAGGVVDATAQLVRLVDGEPLPEPVASNPTGRDSGDEWLFALFAAFIATLIARSRFDRLPAGLRILFTVAAGALAAWLLSLVVFVGGIGAVIGFFTGLMGRGGGGGGRYARHHDWGGFGGGSSGSGSWGGGGSSGGGWSGGGGMSGGGGASGGW